MQKTNIILENGETKEVYSIFYLYNSKYYLIYTEKVLDENGYVILHLVQVGKEIKNTPDGPLDTGYMLGTEIQNSAEWKSVQQSITQIVEHKKGNAQSVSIQYLPINMLTSLKIISKNNFRLMKNIIENNFNVKINDVENAVIQENSNVGEVGEALEPVVPETNIKPDSVSSTDNSSESFLHGNTIIDYRTKFFEEQDKNKQLQEQINTLSQKLENIKKIME